MNENELRKCLYCDNLKSLYEFHRSDGKIIICNLCYTEQLNLEKINSKKCHVCKQIKNLEEFDLDYRNKSKKKTICKCCRNTRINPTRRKHAKNNRNIINKHYLQWKTNHPQEVIFNSVKNRANYNDIIFNLEKSDIIVPELCPVFGTKLKWGNNQNRDNSPSLDRLIPADGYIKKNIRIISNRANQIKNNGTAEEHERIAIYIRENTIEDYQI